MDARRFLWITDEAWWYREDERLDLLRTRWAAEELRVPMEGFTNQQARTRCHPDRMCPCIFSVREEP